jgi:hypothetical protein
MPLAPRNLSKQFESMDPKKPAKRKPDPELEALEVARQAKRVADEDKRLVNSIVNLPPGLRQYAGTFAYRARDSYPMWDCGGLIMHRLHKRPFIWSCPLRDRRNSPTTRCTNCQISYSRRSIASFVSARV